MTLIVIFLATFVFLIFFQHYRESSAFPPGYFRWPIIGSALSFIGAVGSGAIIKAAKDAYKYNDGKFMGVFVGPIVRAVFVFDFDIAKDIVFSDKYIGKYYNDYTRHLRGYNGTPIGIIQTEGQTWKRNRRFSLSTLKGRLNLGRQFHVKGLNLTCHYFLCTG